MFQPGDYSSSGNYLSISSKNERSLQPVEELAESLKYIEKLEEINANNEEVLVKQ